MMSILADILLADEKMFILFSSGVIASAMSFGILYLILNALCFDRDFRASSDGKNEDSSNVAINIPKVFRLLFLFVLMFAVLLVYYIILY